MRQLMLLFKVSSTVIWAISLYYALTEFQTTTKSDVSMFCLSNTSMTNLDSEGQLLLDCVVNNTAPTNAIWIYNHTDGQYEQAFGEYSSSGTVGLYDYSLRDEFDYIPECNTFEIAHISYIVHSNSLEKYESCLIVEMVVGLLCTIRFLLPEEEKIFILAEAIFDLILLIFGVIMYTEIKSSSTVERELSAIFSCDWKSRGYSRISKASIDPSALKTVVFLIACTEACELLDKITGFSDEVFPPLTDDKDDKVTPVDQ